METLATIDNDMWTYKLEDGSLINVRPVNVESFLNAPENSGARLISKGEDKNVFSADSTLYKVNDEIMSVAEENKEAFLKNFEGQRVTELDSKKSYTHPTIGQLQNNDPGWWNREENLQEYLNQHYRYDQDLDVQFEQSSVTGNELTLYATKPGSDEILHNAELTMQSGLPGIADSGIVIPLDDRSWDEIQAQIELEINNIVEPETNSKKHAKILEIPNIENLLELSGEEQIRGVRTINPIGMGKFAHGVDMGARPTQPLLGAVPMDPTERMEYLKTLPQRYEGIEVTQELMRSKYGDGQKSLNIEGTGGRISTSQLHRDYGTLGEIFTLGSYEGREVNMNGAIRLSKDNEGNYYTELEVSKMTEEEIKAKGVVEDSIIPISYIWDHKEELLEISTVNSMTTLINENIENFGGIDPFYDFVEENHPIYFTQDEIELDRITDKYDEEGADVEEITKEVKTQLGKMYPTLSKEDIEDLILYDEETGEFKKIVKENLPGAEEGSQDSEIEKTANELANSSDLDYLKRKRIEAYALLLHLAKMGHLNIDDIKENSSWFQLMLEGGRDVGGGIIEGLSLTDKVGFTNALGLAAVSTGQWNQDPMFKDELSLRAAYENGHIFEHVLSELPDGTGLAKRFNKALLDYKTLSRAVDLNIDISRTPEENVFAEILDSFGEAFTSKGVISEQSEDDARIAFENILTHDGYGHYNSLGDWTPGLPDHVIESSFWSTGSLGKNNNWRKIIEGGGEGLAHLSPLLLEISGYSKLIKMGTGSAPKKIVGGLATRLSPNVQGKTGRFIIDKMIVPAATNVWVWSGGEMMGQQLLGTDYGDAWHSHTINLTTGETNLTFPIAMGLSAPVFGLFTHNVSKIFTSNEYGKYIMAVMQNPEGFLRRSKGGRVLNEVATVTTRSAGGGATATVLLLVSQAAQAEIDALIKGGEFDRAAAYKEITDWEHIRSTWMTMTILSGHQVQPKVREMFRQAVASQKRSTEKVTKAQNELGVDDKSSSKEIDKAADDKLKKIYGSGLTIKEINKKVEEIYKHQKELKNDLDLRETRDAAIKAEGYYKGWVLPHWKTMKALQTKRIDQYTVEDYDKIAEMDINELHQAMRRSGIEPSSKQWEMFEGIHADVQYYVKLAKAYELDKRVPEFKEEFIRNTISSDIYKYQIELLKQQIKDGKNTSRNTIQLKKLEETRNKLLEKNEGIWEKAELDYATQEKAIIIAAELLSQRLKGPKDSGSLLEVIKNDKEWKEKGYKVDADGVAPEGQYNPNTGKFAINIQRMRETRNLGAGIHEIVHHVLRRSLKDKATGKISEHGMKVIDALLGKLPVKNRKEIEKRIDEKYKYKEDGSKKEPEEYYEEYVTGITDAIINKELKYDRRTWRGVGKVLYPILTGGGKWHGLMPNLYKYDFKEGTNSNEASRDLFNLLGDITAVNKVNKYSEARMRELVGEGPLKVGEVKKSVSKDLYTEKNVSEALGITKKSTKKIVKENTRLEKEVIKEGIRDKNGNIKASIELQRKLVANNLPAAFKLALDATGKAKDISLQEGLKYGDVGEWYSDYSLKLVDLARTYRAERVFDPKTKKQISPPEKVPFGAYMGGLLPKKYSGLLEAGKKKIITESISEKATARKVSKIPTDDVSKVGEVGKGIIIHKRLRKQGAKEASLIHERVKNMVYFISMSNIGTRKRMDKPFLKKKGLDIDITQQTFATLKNAVLREVQLMFGISPKSGNLSKPDIKNAQFFINKNVETLIALLPKHHTIKMVNVGTPKNPIWEKRADKATGIQTVLLHEFYNKGKETSDLIPWTKKEIISPKDFARVFGITERGKPNTYKKESNTSARIHALMMQVEKSMVNQAVRERLLEQGEGQKAWASNVAEGKSEVIFSKSIYENKTIDESTVLKFDGKRRSFHDEISIRGLTPVAIRSSYDIVFGRDGLKDKYGDSKKLREGVINDYKKILAPYIKIEEAYKKVGEDFRKKLTVEEYLSTKDIEKPSVFVREYFGLENSMKSIRENPREVEKQKTFMLDNSSIRLNNKIGKTTDAKKIQEISDKHIVNEIRSKNHIEDGTVVGKPGSYRPMLYNLKAGYVQEYLSKHPGYEGLISYERKQKKNKKTGETDYWVELQFEGKKTRKVPMPESSRFDGKKGQKVTQEMIDDNMSPKEKELRKEHRDFHWDALTETLKTAQELIKSKQGNNVRLAMLVEGYLGNMATSLRAAALYTYSPVNPPTKNLTKKVWNAKKGKYVEERLWEFEHGNPAKGIALLLSNHFFGGKKINIKKLKESYRTGAIHVDFNNNIGRVFKDRMQFDYKLGDMPVKRWFNIWTTMGEAHTVKDIYTGKIYGEAQVNYWNKVKENHKNTIKQNNGIIKNVVGSKYSKSSKKETIEDLQIIDRAIRLGKMASKETRGMSAWDFDDTLVITKSGVIAKIPNLDGTPKPNRKVVFLAGGAGSGKSNVIKKLELEKLGFKIVNQDISLEWLKKNHGLPENMNDLTREQRSTLGTLQHQARGIAKRKMMKYQGNADGVVIDGTGGSLNVMKKQVAEFKEKGYDVSMLFVETTLETALQRNKARKERSLLDKIVEKNHEAVQGNKQAFEIIFGKRFMEVKTDNLKQEDAMPRDLVERMNEFVNSYENRRLDAEEFAAEGKDILDKGGKFDFTEFNVVTKGEKGPFFQKALDRAKKFGTEHQFILTARPPEAAIPIREFLKSQGLDIPLKNITGLGNSTGEAKAMWMMEKFAEGYNDIYFADDAIRNVKAVKDVLSKVDVRSKVVQAKIKKEKSLNEVKDVEKLDSSENYDNIKYSKSHRSEYEKTISKNRSDLVKEGLVSKTVDNMFSFVDGLNVPSNKKRKYEQITTKWLATSSIKLKEDTYKIEDAVKLAEKYKEDIFSYRNPNEIIEKYAGKTKEKPIDPKTIKEFSKGKITDKKHGVVEYEVSNTKEGQKAVRDIVDTHFGKDSNPWCITQTRDGKLTTDSWINWRGYEKGPKSIVFQNGKLIGFKANYQYWDRMDNATDAPVVKIKDGRVTKTVELVPMGGGKIEEFIKETRTVSKDKKTVTTEIFEESQDGYAEGTKIVENRVNGTTVKSTRYGPKGNVQNITEFSKDGKAIASRQFDQAGKINSVNAYGKPFGEMTKENIVKEKGDILEHEIHEGGEAYYHGTINIKGKATEVGWKMPESIADLKNVIKTVDGKVRLDLKKVLEIDAEVQGLPKEIKSQIKIEAPTATLRDLAPVKKALDQLDVKSETQQAIKLSRSRDKLSEDFNKILEETKGIGRKKTFSEAKGRLMGQDAWNFGRAWGAEDFSGLVTYAFAGKGKQGEAHKKFFEDNLQKPFNRAYSDIHARKQNISADYKALRKAMPEVRKRLNDKVDGIYTVDQAIRVHLWDKAGFEIPGISKRDLKTLTDFVKNDPALTIFADQLSQITMLKEGYIKPVENWLGENITIDMNNVVDRIYRKEALSEFVENRESIFGKWDNGRLMGENMNKIESVYGLKHREALENILWRMENGTNRTVGADSNTNRWMNWVNNATGTIMFFNQKSAVLQTISTLNYVNGTFNNPLRAAQAFANQPQYWKDFVKIFNSDMLIQRRAGLKINIEAAELIDRVGGSKNKASAALSYLLQKGFIPTKYADSFAIASGGATFYRNSIRKYKKQGLSEKEAEAKAWEDFTLMTEQTQQSSRPDLISMQQASALGRPILAFANTPMQMVRRHKRRIQDVINRRGNTAENITSALYYGFAQTVLFSYLSNAMFAVDDESDDPDDIAFSEKKKSRHINTVLDSYLRGWGTGGASISALKNGLLSFLRENKKDFNADYANVVIDMLNVSPPIGSKARKLYSAGKTWKYNKDVIGEMGLSLDNPAVLAVANVISAVTNVPTDRVVMKLQNLKDASNSEFETWERVSMLMGLNRWSLGLGKRESVVEAEERVGKKTKSEKKQTDKTKKESLEKNFIQEQKKEKFEGKKDITCAAATKSGNRCGVKIVGKGQYCTIHQKVQQRSDGKKTTCKATKSDGKKCKMQTSAKSGYCYYHD